MRHSRSSARLQPALLLIPLWLACITPTAESALLQRAAKERGCTPDKLTVTSLGASAYRVEGCGPPQTFICVSYQGWVCTREGGPQSARRVLESVTVLQARSAADAQQQLDTMLVNPPQTSPPPTVDPPIDVPPPAPPPPTF